MKKTFLKPLALGLCAAVCVTSVGATVYARGAMQKKQEPLSAPAQTTSASAAEETEAPQKDETVYVLAGADGSVQKIIVSDWIKNTLGSSTLTDSSELENVENVKGDEGYTMDASNARVWDAAGNDIYYQGNIEKELPVTLKVSYTLDGKTVTPEELAEYKLERAELAIALPPDWKLDQESMEAERWYWPIQLLKVLARLPIANDTWLGWGHTMDNQSPFAENTELCASLLTAPQGIEEDDGVCILPNGEEVNFYQVIPLYREELDYKLEHGADALLEKMADVSFVVNPEQPKSL